MVSNRDLGQKSLGEKALEEGHKQHVWKKTILLEQGGDNRKSWTEEQTESKCRNEKEEMW